MTADNSPSILTLAFRKEGAIARTTATGRIRIGRNLQALATGAARMLAGSS
jgi:hypothetical protein